MVVVVVVGAVAPDETVGDQEPVGGGHPRRLVPPRVPQLVEERRGRRRARTRVWSLSLRERGTGGCTLECLGGMLAGGNWRRETEREGIVVRNGRGEGMEERRRRGRL